MYPRGNDPRGRDGCEMQRVRMGDPRRGAQGARSCVRFPWVSLCLSFEGSTRVTLTPSRDPRCAGTPRGDMCLCSATPSLPAPSSSAELATSSLQRDSWFLVQARLARSLLFPPPSPPACFAFFSPSAAVAQKLLSFVRHFAWLALLSSISGEEVSLLGGEVDSTIATVAAQRAD